MNREKANQILAALQKVDFTAVEKQFGIKIKFGGASWGIGEADTMRIQVVAAPTVSAEGKPLDANKAFFNANCKHYGLAPIHYMAHVLLGGKTYQLCGINTRSKKNNFIVMRPTDGKRFRADTRMVQRSLGIKPSTLIEDLPDYGADLGFEPDEADLLREQARR